MVLPCLRRTLGDALGHFLQTFTYLLFVLARLSSRLFLAPSLGPLFHPFSSFLSSRL